MSINSNQYSNSSQPREFDHSVNVDLRVNMREGMKSAVEWKIREGDTLIWKTVIVDDVPVKYVHFVLRESLNEFKNRWNW